MKYYILAINAEKLTAVVTARTVKGDFAKDNTFYWVRFANHEAMAKYATGSSVEIPEDMLNKISTED